MDYMPENVTDCIDDAMLAIKKGTLVLGDLIELCPFSKIEEEHHEPQLQGYGRLMISMDITLDYLNEAFKMLERALDLKVGEPA